MTLAQCERPRASRLHHHLPALHHQTEVVEDARLNRGVMLGEGNIICAFVHVGVETRVGNNNFLSAYTSIDHHNLWGSHITTGPAVATSGCVEVEDDVKMGTGIFIQPHITVGKGAQIASGAVLTRSVPAMHAAKTRINTELTPLRGDSNANPVC